MLKSLINPKALLANEFLGSKLGQAAIASTFAMAAMVVLTTQVGEASAASVAGAAVSAPVEIA